jgi:hypothetical protein
VNTFPVIVVELIAIGVVMAVVWFMMEVVTDTLWQEDDEDERNNAQ